MLSKTYIKAQFDQLPPAEQVAILFKAITFMKEDSDRFVHECLALALGIPLFPKVSRILARDAYQLSLLFANGEERHVDFRKFLNPERKYEQVLLSDIEQFNKVRVEEDTLVWRDLGYWSKDPDGKEQFMYFDIDPALLYEAGQPVPVNIS